MRNICHHALTGIEKNTPLGSIDQSIIFSGCGVTIRPSPGVKMKTETAKIPNWQIVSLALPLSIHLVHIVAAVIIEDPDPIVVARSLAQHPQAAGNP